MISKLIEWFNYKFLGKCNWKDVEVTVDDIRHGEASSSTTCPIAQALKRKFRTDNVQVCCTFCTIDFVFYDMSRNASNFIINYDDDAAFHGLFGTKSGTFEPFTFQVKRSFCR